jgi:peptidoglycan hydrolase-like protein with peptidoglycan-binding domain
VVVTRSAASWLLAAALIAGCTPAGTVTSAGAPPSTPTPQTSISDIGDEEPTEAVTTAAAATSDTIAAPDASETPTEAASDEGSRVAADEDDGNDTGSDDAKGRSAQRPRTKGARLVAVRPNDRGAAVERLQRRLTRFGFAPGAVDGAYGPRTSDAVKAFQMLAGLKQTGRADGKTVDALADYESDVTVLRAGDTGRAVKRLQRRLAKGPFDPGPADGAYGGKTVEAVWALEKLAGVPVDGDWGPLDEHALARLEAGKIGRPKRQHDKRWVEFDLSQQVMKVYDPGSSTPMLISHGSSGSGIPWQNEEYSGTSVTPPGEFVISRRISGWRESSLDIGRLYNPLYFNGGIAFHGALSVPLYPASHGCVRLPMHIAEYLPRKLPNGTPVHILQ